MATTSWPTRSVAASPSSAACSRADSARRTARSDSGSAPTTVASRSLPSVNVARTRAREPATTCALVSMKPSGVMTTPDPLPPYPRRVRTRRLATEGPSTSATLVTTCE